MNNKFDPEMLALNNPSNEDLAVARLALVNTGLEVTMVGRIAGVLGGAASAGRSMMNEGVKPSNVIGAIVGAGVGYYTGRITDATAGVMTRMAGAENVDSSINISSALINFGIGYGIASGTRGLTRGLDKLTAKTETIEIEYQAPAVEFQEVTE